MGIRGYNALAKLGRVTKPRVVRFGQLASVEMTPPSVGQFKASVEGLKNANLGKITDLNVNEFAARGLVVLEVGFWFYIGEMIGRGSIIGYNPDVGHH